MRTVGDLGEFAVIERLARLLPQTPAVVEGIGDDCAVVRFHDRLLLVSCDLTVEDVHFRRSYLTPSEVGWRAVTAALSDIAAMGGAPLFCVTGLACPKETEISWLEEAYQGMALASSRHGAPIVGGDTTRSDGAIVFDVTVLGEAPGKRFLRRSGAQTGDLVAVTGRLGVAAAGLHALERGHHAPDCAAAFRRPDALIPEGQWLCQQPGVHGMIDVTDGLVQDLGHMCKASGFGAGIETERLAIPGPLASYASECGMDARAWQLHGGEDYELLIALSPDAAEAVLAAFRNEFQTAIRVIGEFTDAWIGVRVDGAVDTRAGFDHFRAG